MSVALAGCAGTPRPASVSEGECRVFTPPKYVVLGKTTYDQDYIDGEIEAGVGGCGFARPLPRPPELDAAPRKKHVAPLPKKKPKLIQRVKESIWPTTQLPTIIVDGPPEPPPAPVVAAPAPPQDPVDVLLRNGR